MNIYADMRARVAIALRRESKAGRLPEDLDLSRFSVEPPRDASHGDISTNAAMVFAREAKSAGSDARNLANGLVAHLSGDAAVERAEVAGPGFVNLTLRHEVFTSVVREALRMGDRFGAGSVTGSGPINVEYVSANPTGPMHIGHARGAVFGDALANLLVFAGHRVTREYYVNDAGAQVDILARSAFLRYREALGEAISTIPDGLYPGEYLQPIGASLATEFGRRLLAVPEPEWLPIIRSRAVAAMMAMIREDLAALGVRHDVFASERKVTGTDGGFDHVRQIIATLRERGLVYDGRLPPPKGAPVEDWEDREQVLFRSTAFGDDVDRPLIKSDGSYTYFAGDIAYHQTKLERGFVELIDVWGADHGGYVKRMQAAVAALSNEGAKLDVRLCQLVRLMRSGQPVKMSKRSGDFVTLRDVIDEVGVDAIRFMMLMRKNDAALDFDLTKVIEQSQDNPVFYVQYAHARACSILRQSASTFPDFNLRPVALADAHLIRLDDAGERNIAKVIAQFPRIVATAADAREPHRIAFYAHDLATCFHSHWNRGKDAPHLRFVNEAERSLTYARSALASAVGQVLKTSLGILGVAAPEEMR